MFDHFDIDVIFAVLFTIVLLRLIFLCTYRVCFGKEEKNTFITRSLIVLIVFFSPDVCVLKFLTFLDEKNSLKDFRINCATL